MGKFKGRAQQFADLDEPIPKDFDPEAEPAQYNEDGSGSEASDDSLAGTEHYASVGKSKLRKPEQIALGPQYSGSRISREALLVNDDEDEDDAGEEDDESEGDYEDAEEGVFADPDDFDVEVDEDDAEIDSDAAFGESDAEKFKSKGFTFRGSGNASELNGKKKRPTAADFMSDSGEEPVLDGDASEADETDEDILDIDAQHAGDSEIGSDDSAEEEGSDQDMDDESDDESAPDNEEMDASESGSGDEGTDKLRRVELRKIMNEEQRTVVATISKAAKADADKGNAVLQQRKAFDSLLSVRIALQKGLVAANSMAAIEGNDTEDTEELPYQAAEDAAIKLWNTLDSLRQELIKSNSANTGQKRKRGIDSSTPSSTIWERMQDSELALLDNRQTTLEKWSKKVKDTSALPLSRKLNNSLPQSKLALLQDQVAKKIQETGDSNLFDDTKFYKTLLNNFVDQRRMDAVPAGGQNGGPAQFTVVKEAKMRKKVDTKASKGRKMRFTVHEKLQNFMAPEDRGSWEPEAIVRFFGTLLGQKMTLGEDIEVDEDEDEVPLEEQGLMLFRS
ncbi:bfr2 [Hyphodiscus hymeniophilus]|uniref:Protein BFR2 n=1 Tax=Hyphodiscus hymeniophilus TaxID=353542 RepID=A0A9P6SN81_9HELO|nr:bfr2 [Hyphodiscus hymeniophilus]